MEIKFDKRNYRKHSDSNKRKIKKSLQECGAGRSVLIDADDTLIAGNGVFEQAQAIGIPTRVIETDGTELVVVKRTDLRTDDDKRKLLAMADNATSDNVEWDMDALNEDRDILNPDEWGIDMSDFIDFEELANCASSTDATKDYSEDTNYNLDNLYRNKIDDDIIRKIDEGVTNGEVRVEIADVLRTRASQCSIFNFDELCKFYRSEDATQTEKYLLRRLYLVFVAPKELFDAQVLKVNTISKEIYDDELLAKTKAD